MSPTKTSHEAFGAWFRDLTGSDSPLRPATPLVPLREGVWVDAALAATDPEVPMSSAFTEPEGDYCMAGFWGHGVNSYALYLVERRGAHCCFFRLPYLGAYGNGAEDAERAVAFFDGYERFRRRWADRLEESFFFHEMGLGAARLRLVGGACLRVDEPPHADVEGFWDRLDQSVEEAVER
jgi:hypothetical protein